jgi:hypothetical protein|tara:strand:+ start:149 stop:430 length:282 start_codon:yes stop_codon:yes gene_type:complete
MAHPYWSLGRLPRQKPYFKERIKISEMLKGPARLEGEDFEEYQVRREAENSLTKDYLAGVLIDAEYFNNKVIHNEQNPDPRSHPMDMGSSEEE